MSDATLSGAYLGWFVLALPLLGAIILALIPGEPSRTLTRVIGVGSVAAAFVLVLSLFAQQLSVDAEERAGTSTLWEWIDLGSLRVDLEILVDPLSVLMMLVITGVGSLIVLYSTEYMSHDRDYRRFFVEMDFFIFAMLVLVLAANFVFLIVGWALVGLASYLLIGYYYDRPSAVAAAKKAFVINVLGDIGLVLAAFLLVRELGPRPPSWARAASSPRWWPCCSSWAPPPRAPRSRCTPGCRTPWRGPPRCRPSSTRPPW